MAVLETCDVVVVGGGACGSTTAYFLREEGLRVTLLDRVKVGQEASWASAGMIGPTSSPEGDPWFLKVTSLSKIIYDDLNERLYTETGRRIGYGGEGSLSIALSDAEIEQTKMEVKTQARAGVAAERLTGEEAVKREPALSQEVVSAAFFPEGRFLDARDFTATIALSGQAKGVSVYEGWPVTGMVWDGDRVIGVRSGGDEIHAGIVVNAAGAWAGKLDSKLPHPVYPNHGQIMSVSGPLCGLRHNVWRTSAWGYVTPRPDGRVVVGATLDDWGFLKQITPEGMGELNEIVQNVLPSLSGRPILDVWTGLRPATPDGLPTIGPDPRASGGYLWAAGHGASGMKQAPGTAMVLTDLVMDRKPRIPIDQVRIERYL